MFDEPTKGIDVGAKGELYDVINDLARQGLAVIVVSSYLPELLGLSDRVLVLRDEAIAGELPGGASEEDVLRLASGGVLEPAHPDHLHGIPRSGQRSACQPGHPTRTSRRSPMPKLMWREPIETTVITRAREDDAANGQPGRWAGDPEPTRRCGRRSGSKPWVTSPAGRAAR